MKSMLGSKVGALRQVSRVAPRLPTSQSATSACPQAVLAPLRSSASRLPTSGQVIGGTKLHTPPPLFESRKVSTSINAMASATPSGAQATNFNAEKEVKQQEDQPGKEHKMEVKPETIPKHYKPAGKLEGKKALITGGDSGIGRAIAALYAMEGADVGITYVEGHEEKDADDTLSLVEEVSKGQRKATKYATDLGYDENCKKVADAFLKDHGKIDILVNHAGEQHAVEKFEDLSPETVERTFRTNVYSQFFLTRHLLPHMPEGSVIINTASVNAYKGNKTLIDYTASKGANVAFTRALALNLAPRNIRVNGVAPGPIWTPLISATFPEKKVASFGEETPLGRAGHPSEVAPAYVFLASADASYITGQVIHPNGGMVVNA